MLDVAAASSKDARPEIEWHAAPADQLPFPDASFDALLCQQGFQFFPDLGAAVAEAARVTRPGGRVAGTVWLPLDRSLYMRAQQRSIETVAGPQAGETFTAAFGCSVERLTGTFRAAGLGQVESREVLADVRLPSIAEFVPGHLSAIPWAAALAEARPDGMRLAAASMLEELAAHTQPDGSLVTPFAALLVAGTR
jgi:SAM-dependent methyltransferase